MLQTDRMVKCRIIAPKTQLSSVINELYELGLYHVTPHVKDELDIGEPLASAEELSELLLKIRSIVSKNKPVIPKEVPSITKKSFSIVKSGVEKISLNLTQIYKERNELDLNEKELLQIKSLFKLINEKNINVKNILKSNVLKISFGRISKKDDLLDKLSFCVHSALDNEYLIVVYLLNDEEKVNSVLQSFNFEKLDIKEQDLSLDLIEESIKNISVNRNILNEKEEKLLKKLPLLTGISKRIEEEIKKQELPLNFAVTKSSFIANGWIPEKESEMVKSVLEKSTDNKIEITFKKPSHKDLPPVKLKNKKLVSPFEFLLKLYDLPKYNEIDPTSLIFLTFPIFFGFMLGDIGYGVVLFFAFNYLRKKMPESKQLAEALMFAALMSIVFGFVFGEVFGFEHLGDSTGQALCDKIGICLHKVEHISHGHTSFVWEFPRLMNRVHDHMHIFGFEILSVLAIGAIVGFIHINLGLIVGFLNEMNHHGFKHALMAKLSWIILEIGIILAVVGYTIQGIIVAIIAVILLVVGEGVIGIIEIPALASNMLSYMRLGAVGLASVGLALVINDNLAGPMMDKGGVWIIFGILIMLIGHGINILLGIIGPFLHGIRLHYVEFFSKFFTGGGEEYKPFSKQTNGGK